MVVLAVGLEPREDNPELKKMLGIQLSEEGWFMESTRNSEPTGTGAGGIFIAGVCQDLRIYLILLPRVLQPQPEFYESCKRQSEKEY